MKIILVIQSLIILACAYYIYSLSRETDIPAAVVTEVIPAPTSTTALVDKVEASSTPKTNTDTSTPSAGPNDAGMEWPVFDEGVEAQ
ncbi:MAG: hypothetical protein RLZZ360_840 [Candidatus Parcubacteria bacterium]|jgi:hypothetical protein